jgi:hypothetical protein
MRQLKTDMERNKRADKQGKRATQVIGREVEEERREAEDKRTNKRATGRSRSKLEQSEVKGN